MKITSDNETLAENKVLILYLLNQVHKPITNDNLYKLVLSAVEMNYFYYQQFLFVHWVISEYPFLVDCS